MRHLIAGERSPKTLAQLARARPRCKIGELEAALEGAEFMATLLQITMSVSGIFPRRGALII
jgi:hypothetical protein